MAESEIGWPADEGEVTEASHHKPQPRGSGGAREVVKRRGRTSAGDIPLWPRLTLERPLMPTARIGIDVGGVLKKYVDDGPGDPWEHRRDIEVPGAMAALRKCVGLFGPRNVFTLSKCRGRMRRKIETWLIETMRICEEPVGIPLDNILYSDERYGPQGKGAVVDRLHLQLSHFVDDMDDCLWSVYSEGQTQEHVERHEGRLFHMSCGREGRHCPEPRRWKAEDRPACVTPVRNWGEVLWYLGLR